MVSASNYTKSVKISKKYLDECFSSELCTLLKKMYPLAASMIFFLKKEPKNQK